MTTHLTGLNLIDAIAHSGMRRADDSVTDPAFASSRQTTVSRVQALLLAQGYALSDSYTRDADTHAMVFSAPGNAVPYYVELQYVPERRTALFYALCYVNGGRLIQFVRPYKSFVVDLHGDDADVMERQFLTETDGDPEITKHFWVPILTGTPLVHY